MATKGSKKELAVRHEDYVAYIYGGKRSKSSGAAITDQGDVLAGVTLFECKGRFGELVGQKPVSSTILRQFEKLTDEAYSVDREPALALRFYAPDSLLADPDGWVDLVVRLLGDDLRRVIELEEGG